MPKDDLGDLVMYRDRPEWVDVTPVPQDDGPYSVVAIAYKERFKDVYDYLRGILKMKELSERALEITKDALDLNPANYSVWQYRRTIIRHLKKDLTQELKFSEDMMKIYEKNYQAWHHRRVIVEWANDASDENRVTSFFLSQDPKNYHAWQHRQWYMLRFNLFDGELEYVDSLIQEDVRNNSAWNQRFFVITHTSPWHDSIVHREISYTLEQMKKTAKNESAWNYLKGVLDKTQDRTAHEAVLKFCEDLYSQGERNPFLLAYIVDMCIDEIESRGNNPSLSSERAIELCNELANNVDKIRSGYWLFYKARILQMLPNST